MHCWQRRGSGSGLYHVRQSKTAVRLVISNTDFLCTVNNVPTQNMLGAVRWTVAVPETCSRFKCLKFKIKYKVYILIQNAKAFVPLKLTESTH